MGIGLSQDHPKRVNAKSFSTHSVWESEWSKVETALNSCLLVFERNQFDSGKLFKRKVIPIKVYLTHLFTTIHY